MNRVACSHTGNVDMPAIKMEGQFKAMFAQRQLQNVRYLRRRIIRASPERNRIASSNKIDLIHTRWHHVPLLLL
jgi:hypothetical protein